MNPAASRAFTGDAGEAQAAIERFLKASKEPAALEPGEEIFPLIEGSFTIEQRNSKLMFQVWDERRNLVRRVLGVIEESRGKLSLNVEKFARKQGELFLIDRAAASTHEWDKKGARLVFRERFRLFLSRQFPDWKIAEISSEANLQHSLSPVYTRALLRRGASAFVAMGAGPEVADASGILTIGLIWLDYVRRRERRAAVEGLVLLVPAGRERTTTLRLPFLDHDVARFEIFTYSERDYSARLDPRDYGNVATVLEPCRRPALPNADRENGALDRLGEIPGFERIDKADGSQSLRVNGFDLARIMGPKISGSELETAALEISRMRGADAEDRENPLYRQDPESWLECRVRAGIENIDASLLLAPVYGQVPAFAGGERGIIDLLAVDNAGRLAVLELKTSADLHLPLQALDYWMRVKAHLDREEFAANGYFTGIALRRDPPRLLLIAPALEFHPTTEAVLSYFGRDVQVERIGLAADWRSELRIMFRLRGAERP
ncbi:MAG: hypothetical protein M3Z85_02920 [Acidobacteriota bacterium]|nr:hypothetical protein [Acidobacteriota bacterium]